MGGELRLHLSEEGADDERLAVLTGYLRGELLQLDVENVTALPAGKPPPGSRACDRLGPVRGGAAVGGVCDQGLAAARRRDPPYGAAGTRG